MDDMGIFENNSPRYVQIWVCFRQRVSLSKVEFKMACISIRVFVSFSEK